MKKHKKIIVYCCVAAALLISIAGLLWKKYGQRSTRYQCTNFAMGTYIQQTVYGKNATAAASAAAKRIGELDSTISWRTDGSDIARINKAAGTGWVSIQPETASILKLSLDVAKETDGAFDPTILPISSMWDFGGNNQHVPSKANIQKFLKYVDYKDLRIDTSKNTASLRNHYMGIDLGAVGKGAACTDAVDAYRSTGAECGIIAVGGSIGMFGHKADGSPWDVAVRDPTVTDQNAAAMGELSLTSGYVSTSGTYELCFKQNGTLYHHLLNAKTGYPENNGLTSVTIVVNDGALSDALSTACFLLGREKSAPLLKKYNADAIFIDNNKHVYVTANLKDKFTITNSKFVLQPQG